jgi:hypothetical protein
MKAFKGEITMWKLVVAVVDFTLLFSGVPVYAQSQNDPHHPPAAAPEPAPGAMQAPQPGGTMPMMDMCRQMKAGPMTGMGADQNMDPKMMAPMLEMHGELMKAMGDVMMKHGKMMRGGATK